jgi:glycosyltransferase involved in cell wall biosynthesis
LATEAGQRMTVSAPTPASEAAAGRATFSIICLSPQDWRGTLPTNRHQIMLRAARLGHDVLFVETGVFLGLHLWRLVRGPSRSSLARRLFSTEQVAPRISVRKAVNILPWGQKYRLPNLVNSALTARLVRRSARRLPQPIVTWIYDPSSSTMAGSLGEAFAVYDCVDDYPEQAGGDRRRRALVAAGDERAASTARIVFATTGTLFERQRRLNPETHLVPNAGDYDHFSPAADRGYSSQDVAALPRPVLGFAGNLVSSKVDFALLEAVALARPDWTLLLVGPDQRGAGQLRRLTGLPNVRWLGPKPYAELPRYVAAFDVGLIPYVANAYTRSCLPLKLYEYLAAGKPVVASGLPELAGMEPDVLLADGPEGFVAAVEQALGRLGELERAARMALAARNTWEARTGRLLGLVGDAFGG